MNKWMTMYKNMTLSDRGLDLVLRKEKSQSRDHKANLYWLIEYVDTLALNDLVFVMGLKRRITILKDLSILFQCIMYRR